MGKSYPLLRHRQVAGSIVSPVARRRVMIPRNRPPGSTSRFRGIACEIDVTIPRNRPGPPAPAGHVGARPARPRRRRHGPPRCLRRSRPARPACRSAERAPLRWTRGGWQVNHRFPCRVGDGLDLDDPRVEALERITWIEVVELWVVGYSCDGAAMLVHRGSWPPAAPTAGRPLFSCAGQAALPFCIKQDADRTTYWH
jgi:hypothetical protein